MSEPRAMTQQECRYAFLESIRSYVKFWLQEARGKTCKEKMDSLVFSILITLDGCAGDMPGFKLIPDVDSERTETSKSQGENWWPEGMDLGGGLHEDYFQ